jgi:colanic acid biosynthesis glycosyl transferase WcaI
VKAGKEKKRLWVVTELYRPEMTSTGYYLTQTAEGLTDEFEVKVLCGQPNYSARGVKAPPREFHKQVEIFRCKGTTLDKNVIPFRVLNMLTLGASVFYKALLNFRKGDYVLVVTTPPSLPFITAFASLWRGASYTLLIHDNYPEILIAADKTKPDSALVKFLNYCNRWLYKYARNIVVVGRDMFENFRT